MNNRTSIFLAAVLLPKLCFAQTESAIETVVVTGSYAPLPVSTLTSSVAILDQSTLQALNKSNIADVLKTITGLSVEEQGGAGGLTAVSIRGGEANFTLVLVDGVPQNDPTNSRGGSYDFANLDPTSVERIEVVRGPQSAVYGSDGLAGVINVITRRGQEKHRQQLRAEWGQDDFQNLQLGASGSIGDFQYAIDMAHRDAGEQTEGSTRETDSANLRLGWQLTDSQQLQASYRYLDGKRSSYPEQSGGPEFALSDKLDKSDFKDETFALAWQLELSEHWHSTLRGDSFVHEETYTSPGIEPFFAVPPNSADTEFQRDQLQWVNTLQFGDNYQLNLGADYRHEDGESRGILDLGFIQLPTDFQLDRNTTGIFGDIHARLLPALIVQASVRYDDPSDFSSETTFKLGSKYQLNQAIALSANWGEAFKLPSFFALGHALVGNPDLKPETVRSWDIGLEWLAAPDLNMSATYFFNDYRDLVDFDSEQFINVNRSRVESNGGELHIDWQVNRTLGLQARATYTDLDVKDATTVLLGRPQWLAGVTGRWQLAADWSTALDYQWVGEQYASSLHTGESVIEELHDYHRLDWNLHFRLSPSIALDLAVDNLLDEQYQTAVGFVAVGRTARLAITASNIF
ncbi:MAG: TonB-dependent receptor [Proteobacteria bacterium]|nr:TonB-dependent receptor [Pseudomonadota bacterium]